MKHRRRHCDRGRSQISCRRLCCRASVWQCIDEMGQQPSGITVSASSCPNQNARDYMTARRRPVRCHRCYSVLCRPCHAPMSTGSGSCQRCSSTRWHNVVQSPPSCVFCVRPSALTVAQIRGIINEGIRSVTATCQNAALFLTILTSRRRFRLCQDRRTRKFPIVTLNV